MSLHWRPRWRWERREPKWYRRSFSSVEVGTRGSTSMPWDVQVAWIVVKSRVMFGVREIRRDRQLVDEADFEKITRLEGPGRGPPFLATVPGTPAQDWNVPPKPDDAGFFSHVS